MTDTLTHRGPDSRGAWYDAERGIGLGHRRLSIRELSPLGAQPMTSSCGRFVIVYNGEVYSHGEIAADLPPARRPKGHSDTEIILEAFAQWGVEAVVPRLIGMFAIALYDKQTGELALIRDRLGIKPLYWAAIDGLLLFGSELKALRAVPGWAPKLNRDALASFMRHNYIPAPHTIYRGVLKLEPGTWAKVGRDGSIDVVRYWDLRSIAERGVASPLDIGDGEAIDRLDALLSDSVRRRLVSDVPIGALLSGGIDSSLVAAMMAETAGRAVRTFSIGFAEKGFDEAPFARAVARHIGTVHDELYASAEQALDMVEKLPTWYDEPFADSSQLPMAIVCALTRRHVTVVLSGDGGDELFAGYSRYTEARELWRTIGACPSRIRTAVAHAVAATPTSVLDAFGERLPGRLRKAAAGSKLKELASAVVADDSDVLYRRMLSHWQDPDSLVLGACEPKGILWDASLKRSMPDPLDRMMLLDALTYLPDDILTKVDRASMNVALEARVPLIDHRVVEFAWSLPQHLKLRNGVSKWALREVLRRRVPTALIERPKMGFGVPLAAWLRGPLRSWAEWLIDESRLRQQGLFDTAKIRACWKAHLGGTDWAYPLWNVLMVEAWLDANAGVSL